MVKYIIASVFFITIVGYLFVVQINSTTLARISKENNTYHRTVACILSVPLATRTPEYIDRCYDQAEKVNSVKVDRFNHR